MNSLKRLSRIGMALLVPLALLGAGCGGQRKVLVKQYLLEYPPPRVAGRRLPVALKVERLAASEDYRGSQMVFRPAPRQRGVYNYHRWRVSPAEMVQDLLLRDLRASGRFAVVLGPQGSEPARFLLQGGVDGFYEGDDPKGWRAHLSLHLALIDSKATKISRRVLFQRTFEASAAIAQKGAPGLAQAMSKAMAQASARIGREIHRSIARRLAEKKGKRRRH